VGMPPRSTVVRAAPLCACVLLQASHHAPPRAKAVAEALPAAVALLPTVGAHGSASSEPVRQGSVYRWVRVGPWCRTSTLAVGDRLTTGWPAVARPPLLCRRHEEDEGRIPPGVSLSYMTNGPGQTVGPICRFK
jgi:hypothetical protein